jgi:hypothetical protein
VLAEDELDGYTDWETIGHCQQGDLMHGGHYTGRVCRKPAACRAERQCYFVAVATEHFLKAERLGIDPFGWVPDPKPHKLRLRKNPQPSQRHFDRATTELQEWLL